MHSRARVASRGCSDGADARVFGCSDARMRGCGCAVFGRCGCADARVFGCAVFGWCRCSDGADVRMVRMARMVRMRGVRMARMRGRCGRCGGADARTVRRCGWCGWCGWCGCADVRMRGWCGCGMCDVAMLSMGKWVVILARASGIGQFSASVQRVQPGERLRQVFGEARREEVPDGAEAHEARL